MYKDPDRFGKLDIRPSEPPRAQRCENCAYFALAVPGKLPPTCRIEPVKLVAGGPGQIVGVFPPTDPIYWCARWLEIDSDAVDAAP